MFLCAESHLHLQKKSNSVFGLLQVVLVRWNEPFQKLATCDMEGGIFVWIQYEGRWSVELVNDRGAQVGTFFLLSHSHMMYYPGTYTTTLYRASVMHVKTEKTTSERTQTYGILMTVSCIRTQISWRGIFLPSRWVTSRGRMMALKPSSRTVMALC